jgi:hypothetical protein
MGEFWKKWENSWRDIGITDQMNFLFKRLIHEAIEILNKIKKNIAISHSSTLKRRAYIHSVIIKILYKLFLRFTNRFCASMVRKSLTLLLVL